MWDASLVQRDLENVFYMYFPLKRKAYSPGVFAISYLSVYLHILWTEEQTFPLRNKGIWMGYVASPDYWNEDN